MVGIRSLSIFIAASALWATATPASAMSIVGYATDFDGSTTIASGVSASWSGAAVQSVQGYAGLGATGNQFAGDFLSSYASTNPATLTLSNLPTHASIDLTGLLAIIDSWDSIDGSCCTPDYMQILVDSSVAFSDTYAIALGTVTNTQSLTDIGGGTQQRGFNTGWLDRAYDLESALSNIAHTGSTLTVQFLGTGAGWQGGTDEAWGVDNLSITLNDVELAAVPEPAGLFVWGAGLAALARARRRRRAA